MAQIILTDVSITINAVDLSSRANSCTLNYEKDSVEITTFGSVGHLFTGGLESNSLDIEMFQDFAVSQVEATIYPLVGTPTTVLLTPTTEAVSATNPSYTLTNTMLVAHTPINGAVGEAGMTSLSFSGGVLTKATS
tara:strand:- start:5394 stop:5801 length:408 start_codon:yes stop_codon:yes gene_type:complete